ncbi:MAG: hypothetical protein HXN34_08210 [Prevotella histicola]|nr:hypothetical protein [Prevotella histicola]
MIRERRARLGRVFLSLYRLNPVCQPPASSLSSIAITPQLMRTERGNRDNSIQTE